MAFGNQFKRKMHKRNASKERSNCIAFSSTAHRRYESYRTVYFRSVPARFVKKRINLAIMMREPYEADDMMARSIQPTRSNSFNNDSEDLRMLP